MGTLFSALSASASSLTAFEKALDITQNNVGNASTPGFAAQQTNFVPAAFAVDGGFTGGISRVEAISTRDNYSEQSVRRQFSQLGSAEQQARSLARVQSNFDISGQTGLSGNLAKFFQSFSALSAAPNNPTTRQAVIASAQNIAQSFQETARGLAQASADASRELQALVGKINQIGTDIQGFNHQLLTSPTPDAGLDAKLQNSLENLSELTNYTSTTAPDGSVTVLIGGQTPLVSGDRAYTIQVGTSSPSASSAFPGGTPPAQLRDQNGQDITAQVTQGQLGGLLQVRNSILPSLNGDPNQQGSLNQLAQGFAARVNTLLTSGNISDGPPPVPGVPLFTYDTVSSTNTAISLAVDPAVTAQQIATIDPGPPEQSNGIAVKLGNLANSTNPADQINGLDFTQFYGQVAATVGQSLSTANDATDLQTHLVAQARSLRNQLSGVSLDEEAIHVVQFQRAYQATARLVTVLNDLSQTTIDIIK